MHSQTIIENQLENVCSEFDESIKRNRQYGLKLWVNIIRRKLTAIISAREAKDKKIYGELMQIETLAKECEPSEASAKLIKKIQKLKGVVGVLCLGVLCLATMKFSVVRSHARVNQARVVRVAKRRKEGESA